MSITEILREAEADPRYAKYFGKKPAGETPEEAYHRAVADMKRKARALQDRR